MAIKTRAQLKAIFVTGATPTQADFADLLDSYLHQGEGGGGGGGGGSAGTLSTPIETNSVNAHGISTTLYSKIVGSAVEFSGRSILSNYSDGSSIIELPLAVSNGQAGGVAVSISPFFNARIFVRNGNLAIAAECLTAGESAEISFAGYYYTS